MLSLLRLHEYYWRVDESPTRGVRLVCVVRWNETGPSFSGRINGALDGGFAISGDCASGQNPGDVFVFDCDFTVDQHKRHAFRVNRGVFE